MKILFATEYYHPFAPGGTPWSLRLLARALSARGDEVVVVTPNYGADARETVRRALASLTPRQRAAIVMTELLGFSSSEAGKVLGIRPGTVRALATQGRAAFRDLLEDPDA